MPTRAQLDASLDALHASLPPLRSANAEMFDYEAFQRQADDLVGQARPADKAHVRERVNCLLGSAGLIPSDNEDEPCA
ncbi:MAG TPA: hypothetical protein DDZ67_10735 [Xanthomonadaceae bacterium]|nr:hypothetical protein [Xanthomonadaceae bacterium]